MDTKRNQPLSRDAMAYVLAGGSAPSQGIDRPSRQAGGLFRRQDSHHRLCAPNALNSGIRRLAVATQYGAPC